MKIRYTQTLFRACFPSCLLKNMIEELRCWINIFGVKGPKGKYRLLSSSVRPSVCPSTCLSVPDKY